MPLEAKRDIRREITSRRRALSPETRREADAAICARLTPLLIVPPPRQLRIAAYVPLLTEVQLGSVLEAVIARYGDVALPVYLDGDAPALALCTDTRTLVCGAHDVRVPPSPWTLVEPENIDIIVVPGVAFDATGRRLGRGAGYYDRLLAQVPGRRVAVAYACQMVAQVPTEPHDARVDAVVTETQLYATRDWRIDAV